MSTLTHAPSSSNTPSAATSDVRRPTVDHIEPNQRQIRDEVISTDGAKDIGEVIIHQVPVVGEIMDAITTPIEKAQRRARDRNINREIDRIKAGNERRDDGMAGLRLEAARAIAVSQGRQPSNRAAMEVLKTHRDAATFTVIGEALVTMAKTVRMQAEEIRHLRKEMGSRVEQVEGAVRPIARHDPAWWNDRDADLDVYRQAYGIFRKKPDTADPLSWASGQLAQKNFWEVVEDMEGRVGKSLLRKATTAMDPAALDGQRKQAYIGETVHLMDYLGSMVLKERTVGSLASDRRPIADAINRYVHHWSFMRPPRKEGQSIASTKEAAQEFAHAAGATVSSAPSSNQYT